MKQKFRQTTVLLLLLLMCVSLMPADALADSSAVQTVAVDVTYGQTEARTMLAMINDFRTGSDAWAWNSDNTEKVSYTGLRELTYDYKLEKIAMQRAAEIAVSYGHARPNGTAWSTLYDSYSIGGENIAAGYNALITSAAAFEAWQETDQNYKGQGHRRNMLNSRYTAVGIGHVYYNGCHYWVQEFGSPNSGMAETDANNSLTRANVEILISDTTVSVSGAPDSLSVIRGKSVTLPELDIQIKMSNTWPENFTSKVYPDYKWSVRDSQYASVSGNTVTGTKEGTTTLTATVLGKTVSVPVTIIELAADLSGYTATLSKNSYTYDGTAKTPDVTVKNGTVTLVEGRDYTVTYSKNVNAGTAKVKVTGKGDYIGSIEKDFIIEKAEQNLTASISSASILTGKTASITAEGTGTISYTSGKPEIASVSSKGVVTGKSAGKTTITVTAAGNSNYKSARKEIAVTVSLASPSLSGVTNTASGVTVKWNKVTGASGYHVYRKTGTGSYAKIGSVTSGSTLSYTDKSAKSGTTYTYAVGAYSGTAVSSRSAGKTIKYLSLPSVTGVTNVSTGVTVKWNKVTGASGYHVYRKTGTGSYAKIGSVTSGSTLSYTDKSAKSGTTYTYAVEAYSGTAVSSRSAGKTIKYLSLPSVTGVTNVSTGVTVKWNKVTGASGYHVYRKTGTGSYAKIGSVTSGSTLSYTDKNIKSSNGTTCYYRIDAYSGSCTSTYSGSKKIVRLITPAISRVTNSSSGKVTVIWSKNSKASGYHVKYVTGSTVKTVTVKSASTVSKVISGLTKGKTYKVYVRSYKTVSGVDYYSGWSGAKSVKITK